MAISKNSKNMSVRVKSEYQLFVGGQIQKIAGKMNVEARRKSLILASNKQVVGQGGKSN